MSNLKQDIKDTALDFVILALIVVFMTIIGLMFSGCRGPRGYDGQSIQGAKGDQGNVGATGPHGNSGPAGLDGTQIVPVKFCAETPHYPTVFPEYGLCLNGQLWAVYSANDGFLALIPDGAYYSDGIGSTCNFTVTGCSIGH